MPVQIPPPPRGYKLDDDEDIEHPIASVRQPASYKVGDKVNLDGQDAYVTGFDANGRPSLDTVPPPPAGYALDKKPAPMTRPQADAFLTNLATGGQGTWQPPKTPKFADTALVDPNSPVFGEQIKSSIHPDTTGGRNLVPVQDVAAVRQQMQYESAHPEEMAQVARSQAMDTGLPLADRLRARAGLQARTATDQVLGAEGVIDRWKQYAGNQGADKGEALVNFMAKNFQDDGKATPGEIGVARSVGKNVATLAADPMTYVVAPIGGAGGKVGQIALSSLFAAGAAKGSYDAAGQLGSIWDRSDISPEQKSEMASDLFLNTAMAGMAGAHALKVPFIKTGDPLLSSVPQEYRDAVAQKINSTLKTTGGVLSRAASTAGDVMADVANSDRENVDVPDPRLAVKQRVVAAAKSRGVQLNTADNALQAIEQAKQDRLTEAQNAAGPGKTIADLSPEQQDELNTHLDLLDTMHQHISEGRDAALENAKNPPPTRGESAAEAAKGAGKIAIGHAATIVAHSMGIPPSFSMFAELAGLTGGGRQFVKGMKGLLSRGPMTPDVHDAMVERAFSGIQPADQAGMTPEQNDALQNIFSPYPGDLGVQHEYVTVPPETPHGEAPLLRDEPNPRFNLSTSSTAQPLPPRTPGQPPRQMPLNVPPPAPKPSPQGPGIMRRALSTGPIPLPEQSESTLEPTVRQRNIEASAADPQQQWDDIRGFLQRNPNASPQQIREAVSSAIDKYGMVPSSELPDMGDTGVQPSTSIGKNLTPRRVGQPPTPRADVVATATDLTPDRFASFPRQMSGEAAAAHWLAGQTLPTLQAIAQRRGISFNPGGDLNGAMISKIVDSMTDRELQELEAASIERSRFPRAPEGAAQAQQPPERAVGMPPGQERRQNLDYRSQVAAMTPEQQAKAIYFSDKTGLPNYRAFADSAKLLGETHPTVGYADVDNFKMANTKLGHVAVDTKILPMIGDLFKEAAQDEPGVHVFHRSGDEFLFRGSDAAGITRVVNRVNEMLKDAEFTVQQPDGTIATHKGVGLSHGTGNDEPSAEESSDINKSASKAAAAGTSAGSADAGPASSNLAAQSANGQPSTANQRPGQDLLSGQRVIGQPPASAPRAGFPMPPTQKTVPAASLQPGDAAMVPTSELHADPSRFQYKGGTDEQGVTNALKDQSKYDQNKGGVLLTWKDPADGKVYVINGHHRFELAQRAGEPAVLARAIEAPDADAAKVIGAETNISEGHGSLVDAARFFKGAGIKTQQDAMNRNLPLGQAKVTDGLALARLDGSILDKVEAGKIPEGKAAEIGRATDNPAQQEAVLQAIAKAESRSGREMNTGEVASIARQVKDADTHVDQGQDLFGAFSREHSLFGEQAAIDDYVIKQLRNDKRTFGAVASKTRAETLGKVQDQKINPEENQRIAEQASQAEEIYTKLVNGPGPLNDIRKNAAKDLASRYSKPQEVKAKAYDAIRQELQKQISGQPQEPMTSEDRRKMMVNELKGGQK